MVAINDDHDHGETCADCTLRKGMAEFLAWAAESDEQTWHDATAEILETATAAVGALTALRASSFQADDLGDDEDAAALAAAALLRLSDAVRGLWDIAMTDDDGEDAAVL